MPIIATFTSDAYTVATFTIAGLYLSPTVAESIAALRSHLAASANPARAASAARYFAKHAHLAHWGIKSADVVAAAKLILLPAVRAEGTSRVAAVCNAVATLAADNHIEMKQCAHWLLDALSPALTRAHGDAVSIIETIGRVIDAGNAADWATCDGLSARGVAPSLRAHPELAGPIQQWASSSNPWKSRASCVAFARAGARDLRFDTALLAACNSAAARHPTDYFVNLGVGWALKELGARNSHAVTIFLSEHADLARIAVRTALEKVPSEVRREAMKRGRGSRSSVAAAANDIADAGTEPHLPDKPSVVDGQPGGARRRSRCFSLKRQR